MVIWKSRRHSIALVSYDVRVEGERVFVSIPEEAQDRRAVAMSVSDPVSDPRQFVIIGAGAAGLAAAQTLREEGFRGNLVMITREDRAPYDRPNLSKDYLHGHAEPEWMPLRPRRVLQRARHQAPTQQRGHAR